MTTDWCPGIREACSHWRDAQQQRFLDLLRHFTVFGTSPGKDGGRRPGQDHRRRDRGRADQARRECGQVAQIRPLPAVLGLRLI